MSLVWQDKLTYYNQDFVAGNQETGTSTQEDWRTFQLEEPKFGESTEQTKSGHEQITATGLEYQVV